MNSTTKNSNIQNLNYYPPDVNENDNMLFILYNQIIYTYDGQKWSQIFINDINLPGTEFKNLKKPSLTLLKLNLSVFKHFIY